ncbi:MAG: DUF2231 domain-containing protein [Myxococcota bacterium]
MEAILPGLAVTANLHPIFVHLPLALWPCAMLFWVLALLRRSETLWRAGCWVLYAALVGSMLATGTGLWAEEQLGHDSPAHDLVHVHRTWMLWASVLGALTALGAFALRRSRTRASRGALIALLGVVLLVGTLGADRGALLVFGHGVGSQREPPPAAGAESHADEHGEHGTHP